MYFLVIKKRRKLIKEAFKTSKAFSNAIQSYQDGGWTVVDGFRSDRLELIDWI